MGYAAALFVFPFINIPYLAIISGLSFGIFYLSAKVFKVGQIDIAENDKADELIDIAFVTSLLSACAQWLAAGLLYFISGYLNIFNNVLSEWSISLTNSYSEAAIYFVIWNVLYLLFQHLFYRRQIRKFNAKKKIKYMYLFIEILLSILVTISLILIFFNI